MHGFYIIANINGQYRSLASATITAWRFNGRKSLRICNRLCEIFQAEENRLALEHEIRWAETIRDHDWDIYDAEDAPRLPFILTCLVVGAAVNKDSNDFPDDILPHPWQQKYNQVQGNTIIDITDPAHPQYCLVLEATDESGKIWRLVVDAIGWRSQCLSWDEDKDTAKLAAGQTLEEYRANDPDHQAFLALTERMDKFKLMEMATLKNAWRRGRWYIDDDVEGRLLERMRLEEIEEAKKLKGRSGRGSGRVKTLRQTAMEKSIQQLSTCSWDTMSLILKESQLYEDFAPTMKATIYNERHNLPAENAAVPVMAYIGLNHNGILDLGPFDLDETQLSRLIFDSPLTPSRGDLHTLSLSGNSHISEPLLRMLLEALPGITTLHLLNVPLISLREKVELAREFDIVYLYDSELFAKPFLPDPGATDENCYVKPLVTQMILVSCGTRPVSPGREIEALFHQNTPDAFTAAFSFLDTNRPQKLILDALGRFLGCFYTKNSGNVYPHECTQYAGLLAYSFAIAELDTELTNRINALSANLYSTFRQGELHGHGALDALVNNPICAPQDLPQIREGEWTLVLSQCPLEDRRPGSEEGEDRGIMKAVFVTLKSTCSCDGGTGGNEGSEDEGLDRIVVTDVVGFLESITADDEDDKPKMLAAWENRQQGDPNPIGRCETNKDVESLFRLAGWLPLPRSKCIGG